MMSKLMDDLTADEAQLIAELRQLKTDVTTDAAQIVADAKAEGSTFYQALQSAIAGAGSSTKPPAPTSPVPPTA